MSTTDGSTPGVQSHVPGEDDTDSSVGGTVPDGTAMSHVDDDSLPAEDGLSSAGETMADDDADPDVDVADDTDSPADRSGTGANAPEDVDGLGAADDGAAPSGTSEDAGDASVRAAQAAAFTKP